MILRRPSSPCLRRRLRRTVNGFQATTPGGVADAILSAMKAGKGLSATLQRGVERKSRVGGSMMKIHALLPNLLVNLPPTNCVVGHLLRRCAGPQNATLGKKRSDHGRNNCRSDY
jgi:hypothetical protein